MKQEFITSKGKVIIERDTLFIKYSKFHFTETIFFEIGLPVAFFILIIASFILAETPWEYFKTIIYTLVFGSQLYRFYINLFKKSFASRIPLDRIKSFEIKPHIDGLEQEVNLKLKNGRYHSILFRNLENQYQPFIGVITPSTSQSQLAI